MKDGPVRHAPGGPSSCGVPPTQGPEGPRSIPVCCPLSPVFSQFIAFILVSIPFPKLIPEAAAFYLLRVGRTVPVVAAAPRMAPREPKASTARPLSMSNAMGIANPMSAPAADPTRTSIA